MVSLTNLRQCTDYWTSLDKSVSSQSAVGGLIETLLRVLWGVVIWDGLNMMSLKASNYPLLILPSIQNHGESLAGFDVLDETWTPALLIRWGKKERAKISTSNRDEATTHGPDASANVPCGNWFWLPVWGFTISLLSRVYFAWTSTTPSMSTVIWGHPEFTSSPKSSGNWNKTPGSMTRFWDILEMDLEKEKELMWVWNVRVKQN